MARAVMQSQIFGANYCTRKGEQQIYQVLLHACFYFISFIFSDPALNYIVQKLSSRPQNYFAVHLLFDVVVLTINNHPPRAAVTRTRL